MSKSKDYIVAEGQAVCHADKVLTEGSELPPKLPAESLKALEKAGKIIAKDKAAKLKEEAEKLKAQSSDLASKVVELESLVAEKDKEIEELKTQLKDLEELLDKDDDDKGSSGPKA